MRVLSFFPHNPFPPRSGAHRRCIEFLSGLHELGCQVTLASSRYFTETKWDQISEADLAAAGNPDLDIYTPSRWDWRYLNYWRTFNRLTRRNPPLSSIYNVSVLMPRWFSQLANRLEPELVLINYAFFDRLVSPDLHHSTVTCIDTYDLISQYQPRFDLMKSILPPPPLSPERVDPALLDDKFFDAIDSDVSPEEYRIYDKYAYTVAITSQDGTRIREHARKTRVLALPMTYTVPEIENTYDGPAIFTTGPNPFNIQGYLYFVRRVLGKIRASAPDFQLDVTGGVCQVVTPAEGIALRGYVPDLKPLYTSARFLACPILAKTGQLVKITEAMAHGLPVVTLTRAAEGSPIVHGENGFIARDADEFAEYVVRLWNDCALCRVMGSAARATIAADYSRARLLEGLATILTKRTRG